MIPRGAMPEAFGFRTGKLSAHQARSMMGEEFIQLLSLTDPSVSIDQYGALVVDDNVLGKATVRNRAITYTNLKTLYGLDPSLALFRATRKLWPHDRAQQMLLAFQLALARDSLLRSSAAAMLSLSPGAAFNPSLFIPVIESHAATTYTENSIASFSRNLASSWTQAGYLRGKVAKTRSKPTVEPLHVAFGAFCAWLDGWQGETLFDSPWIRYLDVERDELLALVDGAARQGLYRLLRAGGVYEFRFPGWLSPQEEDVLVKA